MTDLLSFSTVQHVSPMQLYFFIAKICVGDNLPLRLARFCMC